MESRKSGRMRGNMKFNEKLITLRKQKGLSQEELGMRLNVARQTVSKWELGETTPEMEKLIKLSEIFGVSLDELVGKETEGKPSGIPEYVPQKKGFRMHYEYRSKKEVRGLPLLHINVGLGFYKAKGIFAIGTLANGMVSVGLLSLGVLSIGFLSLGVFAFSLLSLGILSFGVVAAGIVAFGAVAAGLAAFGSIAVGYFAAGGVAIGVYSVGGCALAERIAMGGYASAHIAIGDEAVGDFCWNDISNLPGSVWAEIRETILREYPGIPKIILKIFSASAG